MKTTYKTLVLIVVLLFLLSPAALALIWPSGELQWDNGGTSTTISNGDSVSFTTGLFASADPIYATVKIINGANTKILLNDQVVTAPKSFSIDSNDYGNNVGDYTVTVTLDDKYSDTSAQTHSLSLEVLETTLCGEGTNDLDCDGVLDYEDNCALVDNPGQADADNDGYGDVCDNCINDQNILQTDTDNDGEGNACDLDDDNDGILDVDDNCPLKSNPNQEDNENDGLGDVCDPDDDNDVVMDEDDNCAMTFNPDQSNVDGDGWGDACDSDADNDGIYNWKDNCPLVANANQADADNDGIGDACDSNTVIDTDGDGVPDDEDLCPNEPGPVENNGCPVVEVNSAPQFIDSVEGNQNMVEGGSMALQFEIQDDEFNTLSVGVKKCFIFGLYCFTNEFSEPYSLAATAKNNYLFSWQPDYTYVTHPALSKSVTLVFTASDGDLFATKTVKVNVDDVNQIPTVSINGNDDLNEGESVAITITAVDEDLEDELSFVVNGLPEWASAQQLGNELQITGTSDCDDASEYEFEVTTSDGLTSVSETYVFSVIESCDVPCLDTDGDGICDVDDTCPLDFDNDLDQDGICGDIDECPEVAGTEEYNGCLAPANHPPRIAPLANQEVTVGDLITFEVKLTDVDNDAITLELASRIGLSKSIVLGPHSDKENVYVFSWKTQIGDAGEYFITFVAKDEHGANSSKQVKITILEESCLDTDEDSVCDDVDNCPLTANIDQLDSDNDGIGDACELCLNDVDNDDICDEVDNCPLTANIDQLDSDNDGIGDTCELCLNDVDNDDICDEVDNCPLTANPDQLDSNNDGVGDLCTVVIVNQAPVIYSQPVTTVTEDEDYNYQLIAADPEGQALTYYLSKAPEGMTISENGLVEWEPTDNGKAKVLITVSDGQLYTQQEFTIGVSEVYKNIKLATVKLSTEVANAGEYVSLQVNMKNNGDKKLKDLKVTALIYDLGLKKSGGEFNLKSGQQKSKNLVLQMPYNAQPGEYLVKVTVTNSEFHESTYRLLTIY